MRMLQSERLQWTALTVVGLVAGLALALPLGVPIFAILGAMVGAPVVLGIVGLALGTAQQPVIRRYFSKPWLWIVASALGMAIGLTVGVVLVEQIARSIVGGPINFRMLGSGWRALSFATIGASGGSALGLAQWLVLQRQAASSRRWISVNAWSLAGGLMFGSLLADRLSLKVGSVASTATLLVIGSAMAGLCTASTLPRITRARQT